MNTQILNNGDMIITIPKEDSVRQLAHLDSLEPNTQKEFDEITVLMNLVKPTNGMDKKSTPLPTRGQTVHHLKLVKG